MNENKPLPAKKSQLTVRRREPVEPELRFSPTAWAKLLHLRDLGRTEVGGFGISASDDLLRIEDVQMVRQVCTPMSTKFDDHSVAEFFDRQVDAGRKPDRFSRVWVHTHPGNCPLPSQTDEETFERVFGDVEWAVMFILACGGQTYARLRFNIGPRGEMTIPVSVDYSLSFAPSDFAIWQTEYEANVIDEHAEWEIEQAARRSAHRDLHSLTLDPRDVADPFFDPFRDLDSEERGLYLEDLFYYEH
jgi:hypothetical protein